MATQRDDDAVTANALAAGAGDRAALERFVRSTQRDVWRLVAHLAGVREADDLTQEVYLRALRSLPGFEGRSSARTWLLSIARRTVVDHVRMLMARPVIAWGADHIAMSDARTSKDARTGFEDIVDLAAHRLDIESDTALDVDLIAEAVSEAGYELVR